LSDTEVLSSAQRLLDKYFHPSRNAGKVPTANLAGSLTVAKQLLALAESRARREESAPDFSPPGPGEVPQWPGI